MPGIYNGFQIERGASWLDSVTRDDGNGNLINFTGYTVYLRLRATPTGAIALELSTTNGKLTLTNNGTTIQIGATTTDTQPLLTDAQSISQNYYYELAAINGTTVIPILSGILTVFPAYGKVWGTT